MKALSLTVQKIWPMLKFLQTDRQTDGQAKNYMPPIFRYGGIKSELGLQGSKLALVRQPEASGLMAGPVDT
jgi:hypothetical protein